VRGRFDDCQRLVKQAFGDPRCAGASSCRPPTASISAGCCRRRCITGRRACDLAPARRTGVVRDSERQSRQCDRLCLGTRLGAPIDSIVLAHNANRTVPDYLAQGVLRPRASVATMSSAMDVGNPSNLERLVALFPDPAAMRTALRAVSIDDEATRQRIRIDFERYGRVWCPHSAVAAEAYARLGE
jgi:threonine synthase